MLSRALSLLLLSSLLLAPAAEARPFLVINPSLLVADSPTSTAPAAVTPSSVLDVELPPTPQLQFRRDFSIGLLGVVPVQAGMSVVLNYDPTRSPCNAYVEGINSQVTTVFVAFGTKPAQSAVVYAPSRRVVSATFQVPFDVSQMTVWFESADDEGCHSWDSNYGRNWNYPVLSQPGIFNFGFAFAQTLCNGAVCGNDLKTFARNGESSFVYYNNGPQSDSKIGRIQWEVYQPTVTDVVDNSRLWQQIDSQIRFRNIGSEAPFRSLYGSIVSRAGNNIVYNVNIGDLNPFLRSTTGPVQREDCPQGKLRVTADGADVEMRVEFYITSNANIVTADDAYLFVSSFRTTLGEYYACINA